MPSSQRKQTSLHFPITGRNSPHKKGKINNIGGPYFAKCGHVNVSLLINEE